MDVANLRRPGQQKRARLLQAFEAQSSGTESKRTLVSIVMASSPNHRMAQDEWIGRSSNGTGRSIPGLQRERCFVQNTNP